jgi:hypothetical protein
MLTGEVKNPEPDFAHEKALAQAIVTAFGELITLRTQDLPHRFKAPPIFAQYMREVEKQSGGSGNFTQVNIGWGPMPIVMQWVTRPRVHILELTFSSPDGMRLFTLEIEYAVGQEISDAMKMQYL